MRSSFFCNTFYRPDDLYKGMARLDIKLSAAAVEELVELLRAGDFISGEPATEGGGGGRLRMEDFIDLLHTVAEDGTEGGK